MLKKVDICSAIGHYREFLICWLRICKLNPIFSSHSIYIENIECGKKKKKQDISTKSVWSLEEFELCFQYRAHDSCNLFMVLYTFYVKLSNSIDLYVELADPTHLNLRSFLFMVQQPNYSTL